MLGPPFAGARAFTGDDAEELLRTEPTAVDFFNAKVERYPDHLGRTVLWAGARSLYDVHAHPEQDIRKIFVNSWH